MPLHPHLAAGSGRTLLLTTLSTRLPQSRETSSPAHLHCVPTQHMSPHLPPREPASPQPSMPSNLPFMAAGQPALPLRRLEAATTGTFGLSPTAARPPAPTTRTRTSSPGFSPLRMRATTMVVREMCIMTDRYQAAGQGSTRGRRALSLSPPW